MHIHIHTGPTLFHSTKLDACGILCRSTRKPNTRKKSSGAKRAVPAAEIVWVWMRVISGELCIINDSFGGGGFCFFSIMSLLFENILTSDCHCTMQIFTSVLKWTHDGIKTCSGVQEPKKRGKERKEGRKGRKGREKERKKTAHIEFCLLLSGQDSPLCSFLHWGPHMRPKP